MRVALLIAFALLVACGDDPRPLSEPGEKLYTIRGVVMARDAADNSLRIDHESIPGFMEAMTMDFRVRGAEVSTLPPDRSRIEARLHVTDRSYWITDVKRLP
ncbi:MAG TPA: copper-binding protein [Thermoanaerobaculia bacterium]|nr:copper-binding protein [Thermoanaerobaculia bacterium]